MIDYTKVSLNEYYLIPELMADDLLGEDWREIFSFDPGLEEYLGDSLDTFVDGRTIKMDSKKGGFSFELCDNWNKYFLDQDLIVSEQEITDWENEPIDDVLEPSYTHEDIKEAFKKGAIAAGTLFGKPLKSSLLEPSERLKLDTVAARYASMDPTNPCAEIVARPNLVEYPRKKVQYIDNPLSEDLFNESKII